MSESSAQRPLPPHPRDVPVLGSLPRFARDTLGAVISGWRECGDVVRFRGLRTMTLAAHPDLVARVMVDRWETYPRSEVVANAFSELAGNGLFTAPDDVRSRVRPLVEAVLERGVSIYDAATERVADGLVERWRTPARTGEIVDVHAAATEATLELADRAVLGVGPESVDRLAPALQSAVEYSIPRVMSPVNPPPFLPAGRRYRRALQRIEGLLASAIAERRREPRDDLLSLLLETPHPSTGERLTDREARDHAVTLAFATYKGIPSALSWTWYLLSTNPSARERLEGEVDRGNGDPERLEYTRRVIAESLRLYPPLWIWSRPPSDADTLGEYQIPAGMFVLMIPYVTHRHPEFWSNPEGFDPDRFAPEQAAGRHPCAYFPFASGPRACPGEQVALRSLRRLIAAVAKRYRLELTPGYEPKRALEFILRPSNGMPMRIEERAPAQRP